MNQYINTKYDYDHKYDYDLFFKDNSNLIKNIVNKFLRSKYNNVSASDVDDVFQDIAFKMIKNGYIEKYSAEKSSISTWIYIISRSVAIDYMRKRFDNYADYTEINDLQGQEEPEVHLAIPNNLLSGRQSEVLQMIFWGNLKAVEVAQQLGITARTVRCIKHQAINKLRRHFGAKRERRSLS